MAWYRTGTVSVTQNSNAVTGAATAWVQAAAVGETFLGPDAQVYEITAVNSNTSLTVSPAYKGGTAAVQSYAIMPTQGYLRDLAAQAAALVNSYAAVRDNAGAGKFAAGTVAAPSVRAAADENTGVNLPGSDVLQLVTNGAVRLSVAADGTPTGDVVTKAPVSDLQLAAINALSAETVKITDVGRGPAQVPAGHLLGQLAFLDALGTIAVSMNPPASKNVCWIDRVSDTSIRIFLRGGDGVARSTTLTLA